MPLGGNGHLPVAPVERGDRRDRARHRAAAAAASSPRAGSRARAAHPDGRPAGGRAHVPRPRARRGARDRARRARAADHAAGGGRAGRTGPIASPAPWRKIKVKNPIVELDGDEMTRIIWAFIKEQLILPYLDVELEYFDLGIESRDATERPDHGRRRERDQEARRRGQVRDDHARRGAGRGVRPEGDVPLAQRDDPQHPRRRHLPRADRDLEHPPAGAGWTKPIIIGRHAFGDQYRATDTLIPGEGKLTLNFKPNDGSRADRARGLRLPRGRRHRDGDVQPRRLDPRLRPGLVPLRARARAARSTCRPRTRS